ncbi:hypothetical protein, partial [Agrobacterium deltaense]|uniref:hypothetical protein n=1 Tax=Agrobacterium deltaense TaxID=1183412 RepID=UPI001C6EAE78
ASLLLLQHPNNLLFRKSLLLHKSVLDGPDSNPIWRKFSVAGQHRLALMGCSPDFRTKIVNCSFKFFIPNIRVARQRIFGRHHALHNSSTTE